MSSATEASTTSLLDELARDYHEADEELLCEERRVACDIRRPTGSASSGRSPSCPGADVSVSFRGHRAF